MSSEKFRTTQNTSLLTRNDRISPLLVTLMATLAISFGFLLKQRTTADTWLFESRTSGISARYPAGWLVDERGTYVVRIRDPLARPFKTQYFISVFPFATQSSVRTILDSLTLQRSSDLAAYRVLVVEDQTNLGTKTTRMTFSFVDSDPNPFVQRLPVVVLGEDIVILDRNRAVVATFMTDKDSYDTDRPAFTQFLASLRY